MGKAGELGGDRGGGRRGNVEGVKRGLAVGAPMVIRVVPALGVMQRTVPVVSMRPVNMNTGYREWGAGNRGLVVLRRLAIQVIPGNGDESVGSLLVG